MYLPIQDKLANFGSLSTCIFLFCFYPWPYILNVKTFSCKTGYVFSIAAHVFRNLFLKLCPLFEQILITCLKCSRASFLPSSYSEKMRWGRGCYHYIKENLIKARFFYSGMNYFYKKYCPGYPEIRPCLDRTG